MGESLVLGRSFCIESPFELCGDQPRAVSSLVGSIREGMSHQLLWGVTGSGKTFSMAHIIQSLQRPTLIVSHNKTLAAQLTSELCCFFPHNAVEYFVSYYDYYQPEAYIVSSDTYIDKDASVNEDIDRMRHSATYSLLTRRDCIVVASVSCIYGLGDPLSYQNYHLLFEEGQEINRSFLLKKLVAMRYMRNDVEFKRATFRLRGEVLDIFPAHKKDQALRVLFFGDEIEEIQIIHPVTGQKISRIKKDIVYPASHYTFDQSQLDVIVSQIRKDLYRQLKKFKTEGRLVEYQRLKMRVHYDIEMIQELGYCNGIENYSRYFTGAQIGEPSATLLDYFDEDFLVIIDESHVTLPQLRAMYQGDRSRKENLVNYGFRLPAAFDNRPLRFEEFQKKISQTLYVSATPGVYEKELSQNIQEQIIRPTGLLDPLIEIRPLENQVDDLIGEIKKTIDRSCRVLVVVLTKKMAEDLSFYLKELNISVEYLHSDIDTLDRVLVLRKLREGQIDVLVGVNLLREGLDLPEVSLVGILDADKEGFLRNETSLIQTIGRVARHVDGRAILYADRLTESIKNTCRLTDRRRKIQTRYNQEHQIEPRSVIRRKEDIIHQSDFLLTVSQKDVLVDADSSSSDSSCQEQPVVFTKQSPLDDLLKSSDIQLLESAMTYYADQYQYEKALELRDRIEKLCQQKAEL